MTFSSFVTVQAGALSRLHDDLTQLSHYSQLVILFHPRLKDLYHDSFFSNLKRFKRPILELPIPEGEISKTLAQAQQCWQTMFIKGVDRQAAVLAFGGGVICDLAGFVASCYMRGLDSFYFPTTLLAMVDAALGGKTGVNLPQAKNAIGTFHFPQQIIIDSHCLTSLPQREFNSGLAEVIKYGMINDSLLINKLEKGIEGLKNRQTDLLEEIIRRCVQIKSEMIAQDEKDLIGKRATLNYGHTFGHAIETSTKYQHYLHGEAVAIGMSCAAHLSVQLGLCDHLIVEKQDHLCHQADLPTQLPCLSVSRLIKIMRSDKKAVCGKINLILLERIGKVVKVCDVDPKLVKQILLAKMG